MLYIEKSKYNGPRKQAVNGYDITPREEYKDIEVWNKTLNFSVHLNISILRDQQYDIIISMDIIAAVGLVVVG